LRFASGVPRKIGTLLLGSWWPRQCVLPTLYCIGSRPNLELASGNCELQITKNRGACALTRTGGSLYTINLKSACREPDLSISGSDPVPLSKIGTRLLASLGNKGKNRNPLACLRNAGSYSGMTYCSTSRWARCSPPPVESRILDCRIVVDLLHHLHRFISSLLVHVGYLRDSAGP
jgi:hypothetical protein